MPSSALPSMLQGSLQNSEDELILHAIVDMVNNKVSESAFVE